MLPCELTLGKSPAYQIVCLLYGFWWCVYRWFLRSLQTVWLSHLSAGISLEPRDHQIFEVCETLATQHEPWWYVNTTWGVVSTTATRNVKCILLKVVLHDFFFQAITDTGIYWKLESSMMVNHFKRYVKRPLRYK